MVTLLPPGSQEVQAGEVRLLGLGKSNGGGGVVQIDRGYMDGWIEFIKKKHCLVDKGGGESDFITD